MVLVTHPTVLSGSTEKYRIANQMLSNSLLVTTLQVPMSVQQWSFVSQQPRLCTA